MLDVAKKLSLFGKDYVKHSYSFFTTFSERHFVFISQKTINFTEYEIITPNQASLASLEKGLLYDLDNDTFVFPKINDYACVENWPTFLIYDHSVPHVIVCNNGYQTLYSIIFWDSKRRKYSNITSVSKPTFISHVSTVSLADDINVVRKKHIIFVDSHKTHFKHLANDNCCHSDIGANNLMIVLDDELNVESIDKEIKFNSVHYFKSRLDSNQKAYHSLYTITKHFIASSDEEVFDADFIFHTFDNDAIIIKTNKSELGEYVFVLLKNEIKIDYSMGFFKYVRFEHTEGFNDFKHAKDFLDENPFVIFYCRRNDFENISYALNLKTHDIFNYDVFTSFLSKFRTPVSN